MVIWVFFAIVGIAAFEIAWLEIAPETRVGGLHPVVWIMLGSGGLSAYFLISGFWPWKKNRPSNLPVGLDRRPSNLDLSTEVEDR